MTEPVRTCIGCGAKREKGALERLALAGGRLVLDESARMPGRGAYVCGPKCGEKALSRRALDRAFKRAVTDGAEAVQSVWNRRSAGLARGPRGGDRG